MTMNATMKHRACKISAVRLAAMVAVGAVLLIAPALAQSSTPSEPTGFARISIAAGTGTTKKTSLVSIPLLEDVTITGKSTGRITGVGANTITSTGAGWTAGALSTARAPYLLEITSGAAQGRMLLISTATANTTDTVTIDSGEAARSGDLQNLGIVTGAESGDTYRLRAVDTLGSFFGTPESTLVRGGTSANNADTITIVSNGSSQNYFYNTAANPPRWSRVALGSPDASHTPIPPYAGVQYARIANTPLEFIVTGKVPSGDREVSIKNSGVTLLAPFWPVNQTLADLGIQNTPNWTSAASAAAADTVVLSSGGSVSTFFHDGTNWKRVALSSPTANTNVVPVGASIMINKKGAAGGYASYEHVAPYNFQ